MNKRQFFNLATVLFCFVSISSFAKDIPFGIVKFGDCVTESKYGKQEQVAFEDIKNQMTTLITDIEKQRNELATKFNDSEFMDSLSPEAENELQARYQTINDELAQYQNQYMQVMQQANMKLMQLMNNYIEKASKIIAKQKHVNMVLREEACFYYEPKNDVTAEIIKEMDKNFDQENKQTAQAEQTKTPQKENESK